MELNPCITEARGAVLSKGREKHSTSKVRAPAEHFTILFSW